MHYQITVRYGGRRQRYHMFGVDAPDVGAALAKASAALPPEISADADLVELRVAVDPEQRRYLDEAAPS